MNPAHPHTYPRRILLAVTGLSPQIITETLYALAVREAPAFVPTEIHLITTGRGAEHARLNLLSESIGWFHRLRRDWNLPAIAFTPAHIHVITGADGAPLEDIRDGADNTRAADFITARVAELSADPQAALHVSLAGGRKTMGYYLGYALSLFGREQDRLSHVLVNAPFENHREFYYPTPFEHPIHVKEGGKDIAYDCRNAQVDLAEIPFVRLRGGLPEALLGGGASFSQTVAAAQCGGREIGLVIDLAAHTVTAGGEAVKLTPQNFSLLLWLARRRLEGREPVHCRVKDANLDAAQEYLAVCREVYGAHGSEVERAEAGLKKGMDSAWFSPAKNRLHAALVRALGKNGAAPYLIRASGKGKGDRFELGLGAEHIRIEIVSRGPVSNRPG